MKGGPDMQKFENRVPAHSLIKAFSTYTDSLLPAAEYNSYRKSARRPIDIAVLKQSAYNVDTVRSINPTPDSVTSARKSVDWVTKGFSFTMTNSINEDNYIDYITEFQQNMFNAVTSVMVNDTNSVENNLAAFLETNKRSMLPTVNVLGVSAGTGAYEVSPEQFAISAPSVLESLAMYGKVQSMHNVGYASYQRDIATFGRNNERNLEQYQSEMEYWKSSKIPVTAGKQATHYLTNTGSIGLLNWVEADARNGEIVHDGRYTTMIDPFFGFQWGVFITSYREDKSAIGGTGLERAASIRYDFAADFAPVVSYSSTAGVTPIVKFDLVTA